jgi:hypothetical protein
MTTQDDDAVEQQGEEEQQTPSCAAEQTKAAAMRLKGEEDIVRKNAKRNPMFLFLVNSVATIFVFIFHLISVSGDIDLCPKLYTMSLWCQTGNSFFSYSFLNSRFTLFTARRYSQSCA